MIRAKITPTLTEAGLVRVLVEWVEVNEAEEVVAVLESETFLSGGESGSAYVTRGAFERSEAFLLPGTFWIDADGLRHFHIDAERGDLNFTGAAAGGGKD